MNAETFPPVEELVPHSGELVLLDRILAAGENYLEATLTVRADGLYNHGDRVPAWVGMEYMAQAIAAHAGLRAYRSGEPVKPGFLLGGRRYAPSRVDFPVGAVLTVRATRVLEDESGMGVFECELSGATVPAFQARLNVFRPPDGRSGPSTPQPPEKDTP